MNTMRSTQLGDLIVEVNGIVVASCDTLREVDEIAVKFHGKNVCWYYNPQIEFETDENGFTYRSTPRKGAST